MVAINKLGYREIKSVILERLRDGTWPPDSILPNEMALTAEFGCARTTINRALRELADDGLLDRRRKAGTKVKRLSSRQVKLKIPSIRFEIEAKGAQYRYHRLKHNVIEAPDWLCGRISLQEQVQVLHLHCMHYADNSPYQFEERWINLRAVPQAENESFKTTPPSEWLVQEKPFTDIEYAFSACGADEIQSKYLSVSLNHPLFLGERTTWLEEEPITFCRLSFVPGYKISVYTAKYQ